MAEGETAEDNELVIRTMQDDLRDGGKGSAAINSQLPAPAPVSSNKAFPLPPKGGRGKVVVAPLTYQRSRPWRKIFIVGAVVIACLGAVGALAWWFIQDTPSQSYENTVPLAQMIPSDTVLAIHYPLPNVEASDAVIAAWRHKGGEVSVSTLMNGDPRYLLEHAVVDELAYVVLASDPRPYLLVPVTQVTNDLLADNFDVRTAKVKGWFIVHPLNTDVFINALNDGIWDKGIALHKADSSLFTLLVSDSAMNTLRLSLAGESFQKGVLGSVAFQVTRGVQEGLFTFLAQTNPPSSPPSPPITAPTVDQALFSQLPDDIEFGQLGSNLRQDITQWQTANGIMAPSLSDPSVMALLQQLVSPYAFYSRAGSDGVEDFGLVVPLPKEIASSLSLTDPTLEKALRIFTALLVKEEPVSVPSFQEAAYAGIPLRFVNIAGQTRAIDYALEQGNLLVTTSKEGMIALIDTIRGARPPVATSTRWQQLLAQENTLPQRQVIGIFDFSSLSQLLPIPLKAETLFGMTIQEDPGTLKGIVLTQ